MIVFFLWIILPLIHFPVARDSFEFPKALIFVSVIGIYFGVHLLFGDGNNFKAGLIGKILVAYILWNLVTSITGARPEASLTGLYYRYQGWISLLVLVEIALLAGNLFKTKINFSFWVTAGALVNAILVIYQFAANWGSRPAGWMGNPNFVGGWLALNLPFVAGWWKIPVAVAIIMTQSRSAIVGAGVALGISLWLKTKKKWVGYAMIATTGLFLVFSYGWRQSHFDNRLVYWQKAIEAGIQRPILGWGRENFELALQSRLGPNDFDLKSIRVDRAHNEWLEVGVGSGIVGLVLWTGLMARCGWVFWKNRDKGGGEYLAVFLGFIVISSLNVVNINQYIWIYWLLGVGAGMESRNRNMIYEV